MGEVTPAFTYEVDAVMETEDGVTKCNESDADYWGVYERPTTPNEYGHCLAVWIADFARREDAMVFRDLLMGEE